MTKDQILLFFGYLLFLVVVCGTLLKVGKKK